LDDQRIGFAGWPCLSGAGKTFIVWKLKTEIDQNFASKLFEEKAILPYICPPFEQLLKLKIPRNASKCLIQVNVLKIRVVAQPGSALVWGARGRKFESCPPDG
jgi:hypothetical protein